MRTRLAVALTVLVALALVTTLGMAGCTGAKKGAEGAAGGSGATGAPKAFDLDTSRATSLAITDKGGAAAVKSGDATAAVSVPPGAAGTSTWQVTPLKAAPAGVAGVIVPGVYVDTKGAKPAKLCWIGFSISDKPADNLTIVRYKDDGSGFDVIPTAVKPEGKLTVLTAQVEGFSAYGLATADENAVKEAKDRGKDVDWTIRVTGKETQNLQGWRMEYELDLFASGGGIDVGGKYTGHASLSVKGKYTENVAAFTTLGDIKGIGRDQKLSFFIVDEPLASLLTGEPVGDPIVGGEGKMRLTGMGSLNIAAISSNASGKYDSGNKTATDDVAFTIVVKGEDVQVEIPGAGIFPGKILRTEK